MDTKPSFGLQPKDGFVSCVGIRVILNLYRITFHPAVVLESEHDFLSKSASTYCARRWWKHLHSIFQILKKEWNTYIFTMSWGCWKHVFGIPVARPMFLKAELHKESKNGFKTINFKPPSIMIFSRNGFWSKKIIKKIGHFVDFLIFMPIYVNNLDQFKKI